MNTSILIDGAGGAIDNMVDSASCRTVPAFVHQNDERTHQLKVQLKLSKR